MSYFATSLWKKDNYTLHPTENRYRTFDLVQVALLEVNAHKAA
jgi:hypothetical protein